jgi:hypothetical protein
MDPKAADLTPRRPAFQFYWRDHLADTALASCSLAAQGLWWRMLSLMADGTPYGHLRTRAGKGILPPILSRLVGASMPEVEGLLDELGEAGVFSRTEDGTIYSRRMVRDEEIRQARAAGGPKSLGNPNVPKRKDTLEGYPSGGPSGGPSPPSFGGSPASSSASSSARHGKEEAHQAPLFPSGDTLTIPPRAQVAFRQGILEEVQAHHPRVDVILVAMKLLDTQDGLPGPKKYRNLNVTLRNWVKRADERGWDLLVPDPGGNGSEPKVRSEVVRAAVLARLEAFRGVTDVDRGRIVDVGISTVRGLVQREAMDEQAALDTALGRMERWCRVNVQGFDDANPEGSGSDQDGQE